MERQPRILIVDDHRANIELIKAQLKPYPYQIDTAMDGEEALARITEVKPDLVLLDLMMPNVSGYEVCKAIKQNKETRFIPVVIVTALSELNDKIKAIELGADDFLVKPFNKLELITRVKSLLHVKAMHDDLDTSENILFSLVRALEAKDQFTRGHSGRVSHYAVKLATSLGLTEKKIEVIRKGALLHDIGKIGIREEVLLKPGRLTADEMEHIKEHPAIGYDICKPLQSLAPCLPIIKSHHERVDGKGYPEKLRGEAIHELAMITSVVDAYDAMATKRPYREKMSKEKIVSIFENEIESGQWEPAVVRVFLELLKSNQLKNA